jgi:hypothetical protein
MHIPFIMLLDRESSTKGAWLCGKLQPYVTHQCRPPLEQIRKKHSQTKSPETLINKIDLNIPPQVIHPKSREGDNFRGNGEVDKPNGDRSRLAPSWPWMGNRGGNEGLLPFQNDEEEKIDNRPQNKINAPTNRDGGGNAAHLRPKTRSETSQERARHGSPPPPTLSRPLPLSSLSPSRSIFSRLFPLARTFFGNGKRK